TTTIGTSRHQPLQVSGQGLPFASVTLGDFATLTDGDDANLLGLELSGGFNSNTEVLDCILAATAIQEVTQYVDGKLVLTLFGPDTVAHFTQVLQSITWDEPLNSTPPGNQRTFHIRPYDGTSWSEAKTVVQFDPFYDPPGPTGPNPAPSID